MARPLLLLALLVTLPACGPRSTARDGALALAAGLAADPDGARVVLGAPEHPEVAALLARLAPEVRIEDADWSLDERRMSRRGTLLVAVFEDPERAGMPVTLAVADEPERLERAARRLVAGWRPSLELWRAGELVIAATLSTGGQLRPASIVERQPNRGLRGSPLEHGGSSVFVLRDPERTTEAWVGGYVARAFAAVGTAGWAGVEAPLRLTLVARADLGPEDDLGRFDPSTHTLTAAVNGLEVDDRGRALVEGLLLEQLGEPAADWMADAAALDAADGVGIRSLEGWGAWVARGRAWTAADVLGDERSTWATRPLRALVWRHLRSEGNARDIWRLGLADGGFERALAQVLTSLEGLPAPREHQPPAGDWTGASGRDWLHTRRLGGGAQVFHAHVAARSSHGGGPWRPRSGPSTIEGDAALLAAMAQARAAGMRVGLVASTISSPSGTFDGDRVMTGTAEWTEHMEHRARVVRHVGLLAELAGADLLLIGSGTPEAATTIWVHEEPEPDARRAEREVRVAGWERVVGEARTAFRGALGYAADFPRRAERIGFWDRLDVLVLQPHLPRSRDPELLRGRFEGALRKAGEFARAQDRPWIASVEAFPAVALSTWIDVWTGTPREGGALGVLVGRGGDPRELERLFGE